jgi:predicted O-methyltransferase YrrM
MQPIDEHLMARVDTYIEGLFAASDPDLDACLAEANLAGLPVIHVSPNQGKLLHLIAKMRGVRRVLEIGTLAGYSTIWMARALPAGGRLVTLEFSPLHADVARKNFERAGLADKIDIRIGPAADTLVRMTGEDPFDLVFIDADKAGYPRYLELVMPLSRSGTVILADNVVQEGRVAEEHPDDETAKAIKAFNRLIADDPRLDSIIVPLFRDELDGMSISVVR